MGSGWALLNPGWVAGVIEGETGCQQQLLLEDMAVALVMIFSTSVSPVPQVKRQGGSPDLPSVPFGIHCIFHHVWITQVFLEGSHSLLHFILLRALKKQLETDSMIPTSACLFSVFLNCRGSESSSLYKRYEIPSRLPGYLYLKHTDDKECSRNNLEQKMMIL